MTKTVIFDLDGLMIDSEKISYELYRDFLELYGHPFSIGEYAQGYSGHTGVENMVSLIETYRLPIGTEEGLQWANKREEMYMDRGVDLKEGVKELLEYLRAGGRGIVLATSSTRDRAVNVLKAHGIDGYFDHMVFGADIERGKPYPGIFLKACEKAGEKPEECLVLEDSEAGIQAACRAHVPVICVPDMKKPAREYQEMTEAVYDSLLKVMGYLENQ